MSRLSTIIGGYGLSGAYQDVEGDGQARPNGKPRPGLATNGNGNGYSFGYGGGIPVNFAGAVMNWDGSKGWLPPPRGTYWTQRLMDLQPTLARARGHYYGRIISSKWDFVSRDPSKRLFKRMADTAKDVWSPLRREYIGECLRAMTFGYRGGEIVWEQREGRLDVAALPAVEPDGVTICRYKQGGNFAGLTYNGEDDRLKEDKSWLFTLDGWGGNLYGTSYHDAAYDSYCDWVRGRWARIGIGKKLSGIIPIIKFPPGSTPLNGVETDNAVIANLILGALPLGNGVIVPSINVDEQAVIENPELAKTTLWHIEFYNAENMAPATAGVVGGQEYDDKQLCRAWRLSERTLIEATTAGSRADSAVQSDADVLQLEYVDDEIAGQLTDGAFTRWLLLNFPGARPGDVVIRPLPLQDRKRAVFVNWVTGLMASNLAPKIIGATDNKAIFDYLEIPADEDFNDQIKQAADEANDLPAVPDNPTDPNPDPNGPPQDDPQDQ